MCAAWGRRHHGLLQEGLRIDHTKEDYVDTTEEKTSARRVKVWMDGS